MQSILSNIIISVNTKLYVKNPETSELGKKIIEQRKQREYKDPLYALNGKIEFPYALYDTYVYVTLTQKPA
jgi:hypothetical protein